MSFPSQPPPLLLTLAVLCYVESGIFLKKKQIKSRTLFFFFGDSVLKALTV